MNNFKIMFKQDMIIKVDGLERAFDAGKMYAFAYMSDKELASLRKLALENPDKMIFYLTDNFTGCYHVIYGFKKPKDITTENLLKQNRGKKSKKVMPEKPKDDIIDNVVEDEVKEENDE